MKTIIKKKSNLSLRIAKLQKDVAELMNWRESERKRQIAELEAKIEEIKTRPRMLL